MLTIGTHMECHCLIVSIGKMTHELNMNMGRQWNGKTEPGPVPLCHKSEMNSSCMEPVR
jgi:hypothetical protein